MKLEEAAELIARHGKPVTITLDGTEMTVGRSGDAPYVYRLVASLNRITWGGELHGPDRGGEWGYLKNTLHADTLEELEAQARAALEENQRPYLLEVEADPSRAEMDAGRQLTGPVALRMCVAHGEHRFDDYATLGIARNFITSNWSAKELAADYWLTEEITIIEHDHGESPGSRMTDEGGEFHNALFECARAVNGPQIARIKLLGQERINAVLPGVPDTTQQVLSAVEELWRRSRYKGGLDDAVKDDTAQAVTDLRAAAGHLANVTPELLQDIRNGAGWEAFLRPAR